MPDVFVQGPNNVAIVSTQYAPEVALRSRTRVGADALIMAAVIVIFWLIIRLGYDAAYSPLIGFRKRLLSTLALGVYLIMLRAR